MAQRIAQRFLRGGTRTAAPKTHLLDFGNITTKARNAVEKVDTKFIGTVDYMGVAFFWDETYKWWLRDVSPKERRKVHEALRKAGLDVEDVSDEHADVLEKFFPDIKKRLADMNSDD